MVLHVVVDIFCLQIRVKSEKREKTPDKLWGLSGWTTTFPVTCWVFSSNDIILFSELPEVSLEGGLSKLCYLLFFFFLLLFFFDETRDTLNSMAKDLSAIRHFDPSICIFPNVNERECLAHCTSVFVLSIVNIYSQYLYWHKEEGIPRRVESGGALRY